jgi:hypothetical protein
LAKSTRQGSGIIHLGTPTNPTLYTARILQGPSDWQRIAIAFIATEPTLRISLLGQAGGPGNTVEFDGIRFLPPGRNPVLLMAAIFARFLPHLPLDQASVTAAADRRNEWLFSGYIPDPGRTDALLTKMSQECFCTVFKDLDGTYRITADDPDHTPLLHLESQQDILQDSLAVEGGAMDQVYTDFYLWYQRVTTQVTTSQAGQYAAVLYATPDASISQYSELQTLCQQAADAFHTRTRFDFYSDFIADPATADLLLARLVRQLSVLRQDVTLQATLPALPLSITDHIAVRAPLLGPKPFVGELRRAGLAFAAQAPGMALSLTLRQSGLMRGTWEAWDVGALGDGPMGSWPPGTPRVRETWPVGPSVPTGTFPTKAYVAELLDTFDASTILVAATQVRPGDPVPEDAAFWRTITYPTPAEPDVWAPIETLSGGVQGTALGLGDFTAAFGGQLSVVGTLRASISTPPSTLWTLGILADHPTPAYRDEIAPVLALPDAVTVSSILEYTHGTTSVRYMLLGTTTGDLYRWNRVTAELELVYTSGGGKVQILRRIPEIVPAPIYEAWIEHPDGLIILRATYPDFVWTPYTYATLTGTRCSTRIVTYQLDTYVMVATGTEAGDRVDVWNLTHWQTVGAELMHTFSGGPSQWPGPLGINPGGRSAAHPYCYVGRIALGTTPMLELWGFDSAATEQWQRLQNYAAVPWHTPAEGLDTNQGITDLFVTRASRVLYVATGTPGGTAPFPGARIYHYTPGEPIWGEPEPPVDGAWFFHSAFAPPATCCYGLVGVGPGQLDLAAGSDGTDASDSTNAPAALFRNSNVASGLWDTGLTLAGGGLGSALGVYQGSVYVCVQPPTFPHQPQLWRLDPTPSGPGSATMVTLLPSGLGMASCMQEFAGMGDGNWLYLGTDSGAVLRWNGTVLETLSVVDSGSAGTSPFRGLCVLGDGVTHPSILLGVRDANGVSVGVRWLRLTGAPGSLAMTAVLTLTPFQGFSSNVVSLGETALHATGSTYPGYIRAVHLQRDATAAGFTPSVLYSWSTLDDQIPGALGRYENQWYLGRVSATATPRLELWRSPDGVTWEVAVDLATVPGPGDTLDTNTGITALAVARGRFYAATSTRYGGPAPGVRVYCTPIAEGIV